MLADTPPTIATSANPVQVVTSFEFMIDAPIARAAPLFGPEAERAWCGPEWDPRFIYPTPARDVEGAVFTLDHDGQHTVWVNTRFDLANGQLQYVVLTPGLLVTTVDVALGSVGTRTHARVTYTRTAMTAEAREHPHALARADEAKGPEWHDAIAAMLGRGTG